MSALHASNIDFTNVDRLFISYGICIIPVYGTICKILLDKPLQKCCHVINCQRKPEVREDLICAEDRSPHHSSCWTVYVRHYHMCAHYGARHVRAIQHAVHRCCSKHHSSFRGELQATTLCVFMHGPLTGYFATGLPQLLQLVSVLQQQL